MEKIKLSHIIGTASFFLPVFAFAQQLDGYLGRLITQASNLLRDLLVFLIALAVVWFIWNVVQYAMSAEEDGKEKAKSQMIHGIIAIAVIVSIWGIVYLLQGMFGLNVDNTAIPGAGLELMIPY